MTLAYQPLWLAVAFLTRNHFLIVVRWILAMSVPANMLCLHRFKLVCLGCIVWSSRRDMRSCFHRKSCWQVGENTCGICSPPACSYSLFFFYPYTGKTQCISTNYTFPMRPGGMWIWILYSIFVYLNWVCIFHLVHHVKRFESTYTTFSKLNKKTKR